MSRSFLQRKPLAKRHPEAPRLAGFPFESDEKPDEQSDERPDQTDVSVSDTPIPDYRSAADILADLQNERRAKRAEAARLRRKLQREQLDRIKKILEIPIAQVKAEAAARAEADREAKRVPSMRDGNRMTDAPDHETFVSGGYDKFKLDYMSGLEVAKDNTLGNGESPSNEVTAGRRKVQPGGSSDAETDLDVDSGYGADDASGRRFYVKLDVNGSERQRVLGHVIEKYFVDGVCRLCRLSFDDVRDAEVHVLNVHGSEDEPDHDDEFGDIMEKMASQLKLEDRKRRKAARKPQTEEELFLTREAANQAKQSAARAEGFEKGPWTNVAGKGWVQQWVRKPVTG
jgi:hypothetical protein